MADLRQVEVVFKVGAASDEKPSEKIKQGKKNKVQEQKSSEWYENIYVNQARQYVKADINRIATYEINKWFTLNDDYIGQRNVNAALNVISKAKSIYTTVAAGVVVGGAVGGIIAAVGSLLTLGIDIAQNYDRQNIQIKQMDAQLQYQRQRAGYSLTSGRIGEDK